MGKIGLSDIVKMQAFIDAGKLFHRATGMALSFKNEDDEAVFYPTEDRCELCHLIQSTPEGKKRCDHSDKAAASEALQTGRPLAYTCHAGLTDLVVPVVVGGESIGCFYSGQSLLTPHTAMGYQEVRSRISDLELSADAIWDAYHRVPLVEADRLEIAMGLLGVICNHLVEGEIALRQERALTREQRKLRKSAEEKAELERDLREMELRLIQAQLNPHFLFNALNLIMGNAITEDAPETSKLVRELSQLLRNSIASVGGMVTLSEELSGVRAYVDIFASRFEKKVNLDIELPAGLENFNLPALILQPIVENALRYALPTADGPLTIQVSVREYEEEICIRIADNGHGIPAHEFDAIVASLGCHDHKSKLTGLAGLNTRLKYYYPNIRDLELRNTAPGLAVSIIIPKTC